MSKKPNVSFKPVGSSDTRTIGGSVSVTRGGSGVEAGVVRSGNTTIFHGSATKQVSNKTSVHVSGATTSNGSYREGKVGVGFKF